jgi:serine/threonine-protein kinase
VDPGTGDTLSPPPSDVSQGAGAESEPSLEGQVLAGRYRLTRLLGAGGMGAVYQGEHIHMRKTVAVKLLHREMTVLPEVVARFEREAVAAARIEHPNVATATDFGRLDNGTCYLVLEYVEGRSLSAALEADGPFPPERAVHVARQVAEALAAAHAAGVVHRDLKPDNIMLVEREGDPEFAKVLDFGIAKVRTEDAPEGQQALTQIGAVFGTPEYMSPEQAKGEAVDARSDLYALGMILYEMLAGHTAFAGGGFVMILTRHLTEEPAPLPTTVPAPLRDLVVRLLRKDPAERVQTATELAERLSQLEGRQDSRRAVSAATLPGVEGRPALGDALRSLQRRARDGGRQLAPLLKQSLRLGGRQVPLWGLALPLTLLGMGATVALSGGAATGATPKAGSLPGEARRLVTAVLDPELPALIAKAREGDPGAVAELRGRADKGGSAEQWQALGRGYARLRQHPASIEAYGKALEADESLRTDQDLLLDVREALANADARQVAAELALASLGPAGADLIDSLQRDNSNAPGAAELAALAKKLMADPSFESKASEALKVALALERARTCSDFKALVPQALEHGDERSLRRLRPLTADRGCGFLGLKDCYGCLRGADVPLKAAIDAAKERPAPRFPLRSGAASDPQGESKVQGPAKPASKAQEAPTPRSTGP